MASLALGDVWFANGIIGVVMAGWMICIILLARGPFLEGRLHAWNTIAIPLTSWCLIDTAFSIAHGVWGNVLLNTATGLMFGIPLLFSRRHFIAKHRFLGRACGSKSLRVVTGIATNSVQSVRIKIGFRTPSVNWF